MTRITKYSGIITGVFNSRGGFLLTILEQGKTTHHLTIPKNRSVNPSAIQNSKGLEAEVDMEDQKPVRVRIEDQVVMKRQSEKIPEYE